MSRRVTFLSALGLALVFALNGCKCGNGWPYGAVSCSSASVAPFSPSNPSEGTGSITFPWLDDTYTCDDGGTPLASDRGYLERVGDYDWNLYGDKCARKRGNAPARLSTSQLQASAVGLSVLGYGPGIYQDSGFSEQLIAWCVEQSGPHRELFVRIPKDGTPSYHVLFASEAFDAIEVAATRTLFATAVRYSGSNLELNVDLAVSSGNSDKHEGSVRFPGESAYSDVLCRLTHP